MGSHKFLPKRKLGTS